MRIKITNAQHELKNHSCPAGQQRFLAQSLNHILRQTSNIDCINVYDIFE